jgi:hypothetical protein
MFQNLENYTQKESIRFEYENEEVFPSRRHTNICLHSVNISNQCNDNHFIEFKENVFGNIIRL